MALISINFLYIYIYIYIWIHSAHIFTITTYMHIQVAYKQFESHKSDGDVSVLLLITSSYEQKYKTCTYVVTIQPTQFIIA